MSAIGTLTGMRGSIVAPRRTGRVAVPARHGFGSVPGTPPAPAPLAVEPTVASPVAWAPADRGFWVASDADGFVGTVEEIGDRYVALDGFGIEIGRADSLLDAKALVASPLGRGYRKRRRESRASSRLALATAIVAGSSSLAIGAALVFLVAQ
ncbi:MAG: hypothetical protein J0G30_04320 [Actinomycetales bacterium]|nr:hypothetical protein [Actinomycetales bacterium]